MSEEIPYPVPGKLLTVVAVCQGEPIVTFGNVLVCKPHLLATTVHLESEAFGRLANAPVTVVYGVKDHSVILRGRVNELVTPDRVLITTPEPPRYGERREFIRHDIELKVRVERAPPEVADEPGAVAWAATLADDPATYSFRTATVDLSGSGARFCYQIVLKKGEFGAASVLLPEDKEARLLHLPSRVVRGRAPGADPEAVPELALEFLALTEDVRDLLNHIVFEARALHLGLSATSVVDEEA